VVAAARHRGGGPRRRATLSPIGGAAQPLVVVTNWGAHGAAILGGFLLVIAAAGVAYSIALRHAQRFSLPGLLTVVAIAMAAAWCVPVLFSSDVYAYAAYGELARIGLNPYALAPHATNDALVNDAAWQWGGAFPICVYGPGFVAVAKVAVTALAPLGTLAQLQGMRAIGSAAFFVCVALAYAAFAGDDRQRLRAAATIGLNPVAIWCVAEGHNDALALAVVLAGFALVRRGAVEFGAAIAALSALIKMPGAAAALALAAVDRRARIGAAAGIAIAGALSIPLFTGIVGELAPRGHYAPQASLQAILAPLGPTPALAFAAAVALAIAVRGIALVRHNLDHGWIWLGLAAWVLVPNPYPWYSLWLIAIAAIAPTTRAAAVAIALSFTSLLRYVPDAIRAPSSPAAVALGIVATLPLLALIPSRSKSGV
jgi:hypothetical protein